MKTIIISILLISLCCIPSIEAKTFKVATYNLENLFDLTRDGTEYQEYIPNTSYGWTKDIVNIKYTNIARVMKDLGADVVALQEVESKKALIALLRKLKAFGVDYPYFEIADSKATPVKCAVLSKFPIIEKEEIQVYNKIARNILKITLDIDSNRLILFVNHWKSKRGPESMRIAYAKKLKREIGKLKEDVDFILIGDFNSNYNEYKTFQNSGRLNDTNGITGINHILRTIKDSQMVNEKMLTKQDANDYLYNLWLEVSKRRRWSYNFFGKKGSPDNIIVSKGLYDNKGISYNDNSFNKFQPNYLFKRKAVYRWQRAKRGRGRHLGKGYSDHLPIFVYFSTEPFLFKKNRTDSNDIPLFKLKKTSSPQALLNPNIAGKEELMSINGIGPVLSVRIIAGRPYKTVDDLLKVKGIGPKKLEYIRPYFCTGPLI
ncbi:MAG: helix-hairpin-helix domain-containing protein [Desulfobacterales bacterium]|nr:helix-hairpin-helix domain-containing protein [Desulfobacterales bacterium]MDX2508098.1 helix-hairpin-helix domain-containing protein [Desulfobacterales bacterium]